MDQPPTDTGPGPATSTFTVSRTTALLVILALVVSLIALYAAVRHRPSPVVPSSTGTTAPWSPSAPAVPAGVTIAWAYLDSTEGDLRRGGDQGLHPLDQLVVPGLAADYLNRLQQDGRDPTRDQQDSLYAALTGSTGAADRLARDVGGIQAGMQRVIDACSLKDTRVGPPRATATDVARYAACLREGAIADPQQSGWVIDQMRNTAGGIGDLRGNDGSQRLAQFISTVPAGDGRMRTGCMAVGAYWSAAVLVQWPDTEGALYGSGMCGDVARAEFPPDTQQAPDSPAPADLFSTCPYGSCRGTD